MLNRDVTKNATTSGTKPNLTTSLSILIYEYLDFKMSKILDLYIGVRFKLLLGKELDSRGSPI